MSEKSIENIIKEKIESGVYANQIESKYIYQNANNIETKNKKMRFLRANIKYIQAILENIKSDIDKQTKLKYVIRMKENIQNKDEKIRIIEERINILQETRSKCVIALQTIRSLIESYPQSSFRPENVSRNSSSKNSSSRNVSEVNRSTSRVNESVSQPRGCIGSSCIISGGKKEKKCKEIIFSR